MSPHPPRARLVVSRACVFNCPSRLLPGLFSLSAACVIKIIPYISREDSGWPPRPEPAASLGSRSLPLGHAHAAAGGRHHSGSATYFLRPSSP